MWLFYNVVLAICAHTSPPSWVFRPPSIPPLWASTERWAELRAIEVPTVCLHTVVYTHQHYSPSSSHLPPPMFLLVFFSFPFWRTLDFLAYNDNNCASPTYFIEFCMQGHLITYCICKSYKRHKCLPQIPDLPMILRKATLMISYFWGNIEPFISKHRKPLG